LIVDVVPLPSLSLKGEEEAKGGSTPLEAQGQPEVSVTYLKAFPLKDLADIDVIKKEVGAGNILIVRIAPLAKKNVEDVKKAVNELRDYVESIKGDIARLGEERIVLTPSSVKIWKTKTETSIT